MMNPLPSSNTLQYRSTKSVSPEDLYAERDPEALGEQFMRHLDRMTVEGLHSKSDIACELAHRDTEIAALQVEVARLSDFTLRMDIQSQGNSPIRDLMDRYEEEECDFSDSEFLVRAALRLTDTMSDSQARCILYALALKLSIQKT